MSQVKMGDRVKLNFVGKLEDGTVFDSSEECHDDDCGCDSGGPLEFIVGSEEVLPALEQAILGMNIGESRTVRLEPNEAYGEHIPENVVTIPRNELPDDLEPEVDQVLEMVDDDGEAFPVWIKAVTEENVTFDANHPLAGQTLIFEVELLESGPVH